MTAKLLRKLYNQAILDKLQELVNKYPDLRFGQILVNCGIIQYDNTMVDGQNEDILTIDPFYDESKLTWDRITKNKFCFPNE